ncbi:MAG: ABC transporter substrate-binding protein [Pararhodobacter sp.]|nr:ABC transporter substrate-binding protein [Pararhodobacter sp.]
MFFRVFRHEAFDISEMSFSSYCVKLAHGEAAYVAIPVFLSRAFRHTSVYIRTDRGIETPADLKGKRIGIAEYQLSANVWVRGILEDDFGVRPADITWVRGGMDTPGRPEKIAITLPDDVQMESAPEGETLNAMLARGEIDGFIGPRWPRCFAEGHKHVGRLFADSVTAAEDWYRRSGIFPIMHLLGLRRSLADTHPWLPGALLKAFTQSKRMAQDMLADTSATKVTMPFVEDNLARSRALIGPDPWSYGLKGNEAALETFLDYHFRQGLSPRRLSLDELFYPASLETHSL